MLYFFLLMYERQSNRYGRIHKLKERQHIQGRSQLRRNISSDNLRVGLGVLVSMIMRDTGQISNDSNASGVTHCFSLHFCSPLLVSFLFQTFKIHQIVSSKVGLFGFFFFPFFLTEAGFFKKGVKLGFHSSTAETISKNEKKKKGIYSNFWVSKLAVFSSF